MRDGSLTAARPQRLKLESAPIPRTVQEYEDRRVAWDEYLHGMAAVEVLDSNNGLRFTMGDRSFSLSWWQLRPIVVDGMIREGSP